MANKKDLVEAYSFSRRRLVTAFVSGAPGGREVEPTKPGRTIIGGVALAILLVAGAAVTGVFKPRVDEDWTSPGLVSSKERASDYLIFEPPPGEEPVLRPLINITSAMLLFGADVTSTSVPEVELKTLDEGPAIGILDAPQTPPDPEDLVNDGWTACTVDGQGIKVTVSSEPQVQVQPGAGLLVRSERRLYLVGEGEGERGEVSRPRAYSYLIDDRGRDALRDVTLQGLSGYLLEDAVEVPPDWLTLFPSGGSLEVDTLGLGRLGDRVDYAGQGGVPANARVGDRFENNGLSYAIAEDSPVELTTFAERLLTSQRDEEIELDGPLDLDIAPQPYAEAHFPAEPLTNVQGEQCAVLATDPLSPGVQVGVLPGEQASAADVEAGIEYDVDSGTGAMVRSGQWDNLPGDGEVFLVDNRGERYLLQGGEVPESLGLASVEQVFAPAEWMDLFRTGVTLSRDAARCPPDQDDGESCVAISS
ncbi:type VII secretion protein EccB [Nocardioides nanhaiensis]|uniref:Type VII secretion protein EccB n=1 Tax=Nocardioides nanhaiensis TaxID=1476871 RepID=A0ABP8WDK6_9ACTN